MTLNERAPAKVNLSLNVLGRRADGYHDLDSLVAFAAIYDDVALAPGEPLGLALAGAADDLGEPVDNLVIKAAIAFAQGFPGATLGAFRLEKRLPVAAGLGGGSSDAAAALRLLARANGLALDDPRLLEAALRIGADVPVCLDPHPRRMQGIGERLGPALVLPRLAVLLVNPGVPLETRAVFAALGLEPGERRSTTGEDAAQTPLHLIQSGRNDLEAPAIRLAPEVGDVLGALSGTPHCRVARMSGSGATCFGLFPDVASAKDAAAMLRAAHPDWWIMPTTIG